MTWTVWNTIRGLVTLVGVYTVSRFTSPVVPFAQLLICSVIAIAVIRVWMPGAKPEPENRRFDGFTSPDN